PRFNRAELIIQRVQPAVLKIEQDYHAGTHATPLDGCFRRKWVVPIEAHERPLSHALPTFLQSYGSSSARNDSPGGDSIDNSARPASSDSALSTKVAFCTHSCQEWKPHHSSRAIVRSLT